MAAWKLPCEVASWIVQMSAVLDRRIAWRLLPLLVGSLFGQGRQTVASWLRGGELGDDFRLYYYLLGSLGRNVKSVASVLFRLAVHVIVPGDRLLLAHHPKSVHPKPPCKKNSARSAVPCNSCSRRKDLLPLENQNKLSRISE